LAAVATVATVKIIYVWPSIFALRYQISLTHESARIGHKNIWRRNLGHWQARTVPNFHRL
jgi:hypothetical protein